MTFKEKVLNRLTRNYISENYTPKLRALAMEMQETRRELKNVKHDKINVVFVCHRAALWDSLKSVYDACMDDDLFNVTIVTIPNKQQLPKLGLAHEKYQSEGAEEFFKDYSCEVVQGYDYEKKTWFDLKKLKPDYLFFQNPYDICRPPEYQSKEVALYTKIGYVHYGMPFMDGEIASESFPVAFLENTYFHFAEFEEMRKYYVDRVTENEIHAHKRVVLTGYPKLDAAKNYIGCESENWKYSRDEGKYRVMWTPRWNTREGNCTFFDFKEKLPSYVEAHKNMEMLFRPHPQAFSEYIALKQMTEEEVRKYKARFFDGDNLCLDKLREYLPSFYSSDVLITDESSIIPEYYLTGKPIIFTYKETHLNEFAKKIAEGFYWAKDWMELKGHLDMLMKGEDPKKKLREKLILEQFYMPEKGAGYEIKELLKRDFMTPTGT